jgi:hypothetical protein
MAIQETRTLPAPFIETLGQDYAKQITGLTATPIDTSKFAPQVAGQNQLQQQAATLTGQGIGAYQPYIQQAQQYRCRFYNRKNYTNWDHKAIKLLCLHIKHKLLINH